MREDVRGGGRRGVCTCEAGQPALVQRRRQLASIVGHARVVMRDAPRAGVVVEHRDQGRLLGRGKPAERIEVRDERHAFRRRRSYRCSAARIGRRTPPDHERAGRRDQRESSQPPATATRAPDHGRARG